MASLYLGIDTGGTYTDGVLLDPARHEVVRKVKVLTTHNDLRLCIAQVFDQLIQSGIDATQVRLVSLSTTLATNSIVEGKGRPVALFLLGYDRELIFRYGFHQQFNTPRFFFIPGGMDLQGQEKEALDADALLACAHESFDQVEAFAVSSYAGTMNAGHEQRAGNLLSTSFGLPVVQGHHLTSMLNSIRRATTASLNASLLFTAYEFLQTVQLMMAQRGLGCPLIVVRGDASLVNADFAAQRPVEIIHSGPATSAVGGLYLAKRSSALVVDIGGTTTDLSLVKDGRPVMDGGVATVSGYETSVRTIRAHSFGLGGDSLIRFSPRGDITIGPERAVPLAYMVLAHPDVKADLLEWLGTAPDKFYSEKLEIWQLRRTPRIPFKDARTNQVIELLKEGPRRLSWLLKQVKAVSAAQVDSARLFREDFVQRAGLTPTDLLHVTGAYVPWDSEVPMRVVETIARMWNVPVERAVEEIRGLMSRRIAGEIVQFISGHPLPPENTGYRDGSLARWMFEQNLHSDDPFLATRIQLKVPMIGIGAPARAFLPPVAEILGCEAVFPEHYEVANAVGTVVGNVLVEKEGEVLPMVDGTQVVGYMARASIEHCRFDHFEDALSFARETLIQQAREEAAQAGAQGIDVQVMESRLMEGMVVLKAHAVGKPSAS